MSKYGFNVLWSEEDEGFIATCPDFSGLTAFGETQEEALKEAQIALGLFIESLEASGDPLPAATEAMEYSGQIRLRMPKSLHHSLAQNASTEGVSLNTWLVTLLSERNAASSLIDKVCSKFDTMNNAMEVHRAETKNLAALASSVSNMFLGIYGGTSFPQQILGAAVSSTPLWKETPSDFFTAESLVVAGIENQPAVAYITTTCH